MIFHQLSRRFSIATILLGMLLVQTPLFAHNYDITVHSGTTNWQTDNFERHRAVYGRSLALYPENTPYYFLMGQNETSGYAGGVDFAFRSTDGLYNLFYESSSRHVESYYSSLGELSALVGAGPEFYIHDHVAAEAGFVYNFIPGKLGIGVGARTMETQIDSSYFFMDFLYGGLGLGGRSDLYQQTGPSLRLEGRFDVTETLTLKGKLEAYSASGSFSTVGFNYIPVYTLDSYGYPVSTTQVFTLEFGDSMHSFRKGVVGELEMLFRISEMFGMSVGLRFEDATISTDGYNSFFFETPAVSGLSTSEINIVNAAYNALYVSPVYRKSFKDRATDITVGFVFHFGDKWKDDPKHKQKKEE